MKSAKPKLISSAAGAIEVGPDPGRGCPISGIVGAWHIEIPTGNRRSGTIPGGHLLHLMTRGSYRLTVDGEGYAPRVGDLVYYAGGEPYTWEENRVPCAFYSIVFHAPSLTVPPEARRTRVIADAGELAPAFAAVVRELATAEAGGGGDPGAGARSVAAWQSMLLVAEFWTRHYLPAADDDAAAGLPGLWRRIETLVQSRRDYRCTVEDLARLGRCSRATVHRACLAAVGQPPSQRLRELRLATAKQLLRHSPLSVAGIAADLGYGRPQEFSREFARLVGVSPRAFRQAAPDTE